MLYKPIENPSHNISASKKSRHLRAFMNHECQSFEVVLENEKKESTRYSVGLDEFERLSST